MYEVLYDRRHTAVFHSKWMLDLQSFVPPPMMQQPGFPFMQPAAPYTAGQPPNMAGQGHALASAYMAQQQQIAAAMAMGVMPFTPEAMAAAGAALQQNPSNSTAGTASAPARVPIAVILHSDFGGPFLVQQTKQRSALVRCRAPRGEHAAAPEVLDEQPAAAAAASTAVPLV